MLTSLALTVGAGLAAGLAVVSAQPGIFDDPAPGPTLTEPAPDPLRGPALSPALAPAGPATGSDPDMLASPTLVRFGYTGRLERLEVLPELAALDLLVLDAATRDRVNEAVAAYTARFDAVIRRNLATLIELQSLRGAGDRAASLARAQPLLQQVNELERSGSLASAIAGALPPAVAARFEQLVAAYDRALVEDIMAQAGERSERVSAFEARVQIRLERLGIAARQSADRQLGSAGERIQQMLIEIEATPEQTQKIQAILQESLGEQLAAGDYGSRATRARLFRAIMAELTPQQRTRAIMLLREQNGP